MGGSIPSRSDLLRRASWRLSQSQKGNARSSRGGEINRDNFRSDAPVDVRSFWTSVGL
jgi:hypothetical protein